MIIRLKSVPRFPLSGRFPLWHACALECFVLRVHLSVWLPFWHACALECFEWHIEQTIGRKSGEGNDGGQNAKKRCGGQMYDIKWAIIQLY